MASPILVGFPNNIRVVLGSIFDGRPEMGGLNSADVLILKRIGTTKFWSEDGTNTANAVTNRIKFEVNTTPTGAKINLDGVAHGTWGVAPGSGFQINQMPIQAVGVNYTFKEIWSNTALASFGGYLATAYGYSSIMTKYNPNIFSSMSEAPPVADFFADTISGNAPLTVQFTDLSSYEPTSWAWDLGDGETATTQNPSHTYSSAGTYTVVLTVTNAGGSDSKTKTNYITVTAPLSGRATSEYSPNNTIGMPRANDETPSLRTRDTNLGSIISSRFDATRDTAINKYSQLLNSNYGSSNGDTVDNSAGQNPVKYYLDAIKGRELQNLNQTFYYRVR